MKLDTTSYYPPSPLGPEDDDIPRQDAGASDSGNPVETAVEPVEVSETENTPEKSTDKTSDSDSGYESNPESGPRWVNALAQFLSWIMVPFFMPLYGTLLAFHLSLLRYVGAGSKWGVIIVVALLNILVPSLIVLLLKRLGVVQDLGLNGRRERLIPYIITVVCMLSTGWFVYVKGAPLWLVMFFVAGGVAGIIDTIINLRWKISAHAAGAAGVVALLLRIMHTGYAEPGVVGWLLVAVFLTGAVASARLWLGRHTLGQVLAGAGVGFCSVFFLTMI
ncbi:MAG: phosphatase PAP2 family protein [Muribaculaceae bacterium]|nr:phosphatase PAP2 family protein [Muribaculaceae bacterium]